MHILDIPDIPTLVLSSRILDDKELSNLTLQQEETSTKLLT